MQWHLRESYNICRVKRKYNNVGICFLDGRPNWRCDLQCVVHPLFGGFIFISLHVLLIEDLIL
jgi:hypothetical protein